MRPAAIQLLLLLSLVPQALASHPPATLYYSDATDYRAAVKLADSYPYDALDASDIDIDDYQCFSLDDYNRLADVDEYDRFERLDSSTISKKDLKRLDRDDYNRIASENPYDDVRPDDVRSPKDTRCWSLRDYNRFADTSPSDRWSRIDFRSPDDVERVKRIGASRYHFFSEGDFERATIQSQRPSRFVPRYGVISYGRPREIPYSYIPYGAADYSRVRYR